MVSAGRFYYNYAHTGVKLLARSYCRLLTVKSNQELFYQIYCMQICSKLATYFDHIVLLLLCNTSLLLILGWSTLRSQYNHSSSSSSSSYLSLPGREGRLPPLLATGVLPDSQGTPYSGPGGRWGGGGGATLWWWQSCKALPPSSPALH